LDNHRVTGDQVRNPQFYCNVVWRCENLRGFRLNPLRPRYAASNIQYDFRPLPSQYTSPQEFGEESEASARWRAINSKMTPKMHPADNALFWFHFNSCVHQVLKAKANAEAVMNRRKDVKGL
jgi:hypothetical protein